MHTHAVHKHTRKSVIFFDHHDNHAEARAYRLTQTKPVLVLRLVTHGTKEEEAMESWVKRLLLDRQKKEGQYSGVWRPMGGVS